MVKFDDDFKREIVDKVVNKEDETLTKWWNSSTQPVFNIHSEKYAGLLERIREVAYSYAKKKVTQEKEKPDPQLPLWTTTSVPNPNPNVTLTYPNVTPPQITYSSSTKVSPAEEDVFQIDATQSNVVIGANSNGVTPTSNVTGTIWVGGSGGSSGGISGTTTTGGTINFPAGSFPTQSGTLIYPNLPKTKEQLTEKSFSEIIPLLEGLLREAYMAGLREGIIKGVEEVEKQLADVFSADIIQETQDRQKDQPLGFSGNVPMTTLTFPVLAKASSV